MQSSSCNTYQDGTLDWALGQVGLATLRRTSWNSGDLVCLTHQCISGSFLAHCSAITQREKRVKSISVPAFAGLSTQHPFGPYGQYKWHAHSRFTPGLLAKGDPAEKRCLTWDLDSWEWLGVGGGWLSVLNPEKPCRCWGLFLKR